MAGIRVGRRVGKVAGIMIGTRVGKVAGIMIGTRVGKVVGIMVGTRGWESAWDNGWYKRLGKWLG